MSGYARLHRSLIGHPAFRSDAEAMAFAWMVLRASWRPVRVRYKGKAISLERGQLAISVRDFADAHERNKNWVSRVLQRMRDEDMITTDAGTGVLVITICNYDKYQAGNDNLETAQGTAVGTGAGQTRDTEQEYKKPKEQELELSPNGDCASDDALKPEHVVEAWNDVAKRIGKPTVRDLTPERRQRLRARIAGYSLDDWRAVFGAVERSTFLREWRGCSFDWITKKANFQKTLEGNYNDKSASATLRH